MGARAKAVETWPADKVERRPIKALIPAARNARTHTEAQVDQIAASIREWGWTMPVLVTDAGTIIAGHGRVRAAQKLGLTDVPVMVATGWTKAQIQAYAIADNKLALNAGWDEALLSIEIAELQEIGFDIDLIGFTDAELAGLGSGEMTGLTDPDDVPEVADRSGFAARRCLGARLASAALRRQHRRDRREDCCSVTCSPHLMITDPPYGVEYEPSWRKRAGVNLNKAKLGKVANDDRADWSEAWKLFPGSIAYVWHAGKHASTVQDSLTATGFEVRSQIIWAKDRFALSRGHYHWQHEPCWYAVRRHGRPGTATASNRRSGRSPRGTTTATATARRSRSSA